MHSVADSTLAAQQLGWKPEIPLAYAVWQLAKEQYPHLDVSEPSATL